MTDVTIRLATLADVSAITHNRRGMFEDMTTVDPVLLDEMEPAFARWVAEKIASGDYVGWLACEAGGAVVAGVGLWLKEWSPIPGDLSTCRGRVMDVYTAPAFRRRGLARRLMLALLDCCRERAIRTLDLDASAQGRGLYESLGFTTTNEMRLILGS